VKEVKNGLECGISLKDFIDFKEKDIIEAYNVEKIERKI
jgi:translation initiation factor IF-2